MVEDDSYELISQNDELYHNSARNCNKSGALCGYESKTSEEALLLQTKGVANILTPLD